MWIHLVLLNFEVQILHNHKRSNLTPALSRLTKKTWHSLTKKLDYLVKLVKHENSTKQLKDHRCRVLVKIIWSDRNQDREPSFFFHNWGKANYEVSIQLIITICFSSYANNQSTNSDFFLENLFTFLRVAIRQEILPGWFFSFRIATLKKYNVNKDIQDLYIHILGSTHLVTNLNPKSHNFFPPIFLSFQQLLNKNKILIGQ